MQITRMLFAAVLSVCSFSSAYAAYPDRPIRFVIPFSPGGNSDTYARLLAQKAGEKLGQTFIVENRAGAGGTVGTDMAESICSIPPRRPSAARSTTGC